MPSPISMEPTAVPTEPALPVPSATLTQPKTTHQPTNILNPPTPTSTLFLEYVTHFVKDESGAITINVPTLWTDQRTLPWVDDQG